MKKIILTSLGLVFVCLVFAQKNETKTLLTKSDNDEWIKEFENANLSSNKLSLIKEKIFYDSKFEYESFFEFTQNNEKKLDVVSYHKLIEEYNKKYPEKKIQFILKAKNKGINLDLRNNENVALLLNELNDQKITDITFIKMSKFDANFDNIISDLIIIKSKSKELKQMIKSVL